MYIPCPQATFDVQFDGTVADKLDASAPTTAFRQVLFAHSFGGAAAQHLVNVTAHLEGTNRWLDLDYITFTAGKCVSSISSRADAVSVYLRRPMLMRSHPFLLSSSAAQRPRRQSGPPPPHPHGLQGTYLISLVPISLRIPLPPNLFPFSASPLFTVHVSPTGILPPGRPLTGAIWERRGVGRAHTAYHNQCVPAPD